MKALTQKKPTDGQLKQVTRVGTDAVEKAITAFGLDKDGAQRIHANGGEFATVISEAVTTALKNLSVSDKFKGEEVESTYGYLSGYRKPKSIAQQIKVVHDLFPDVKWRYFRTDEEQIAVPNGHEGLFAIPRWEKIAPTYSEALLKVLDTIKQTRNGMFKSYHEGQISEERLRQSARTQKAWKELSDAQGNPDILIVPAQFGLRHRGRSVRRAREVFLINEFGLGAFAIGIMLLTHAERLQHYNDLWIDCAGDEFDITGSDVRFSGAPCFGFRGGGVEFGTRWFGGAYDYYGSASGLVPQK